LDLLEIAAFVDRKLFKMKRPTSPKGSYSFVLTYSVAHSSLGLLPRRMTIKAIVSGPQKFMQLSENHKFFCAAGELSLSLWPPTSRPLDATIDKWVCRDGRAYITKAPLSFGHSSTLGSYLSCTKLKSDQAGFLSRDAHARSVLIVEPYRLTF
jgi:hypothetical protein